MAAEKQKIEVEIRDERIIPIFRGALPTAHQLVVTYQPVGVAIPRTVWVLAEDIFPENSEEFLKEYAAKKGALFDSWLKIRAEKIREDLEARKAYKPEKVTV